MSVVTPPTPKADEHHSHWYRSERVITRMMLSGGTFIIVLLIIVGIQQKYLNDKDKTIEFLSMNRTMIGFPNERGIYVSTDKVPLKQIARFGWYFATNFFNYGPDTVKDNLETARGMMDPKVALNFHEYFQSTYDIVKRDGVSRNTTLTKQCLVPTEFGYIAYFIGILTEFSGGTPHGDPRRIPISVRMTRVPITTGTPEGLVVSGVTDKEQVPAECEKPATDPVAGAPAQPTGEAR